MEEFEEEGMEEVVFEGDADTSGNAQDSGGDSGGRPGGKNAILPQEVKDKRIPRKCLNEIHLTLQKNNAKAALKDKMVSSKTQSNRTLNVMIFFKVLFYKKYKITTIYSLKPKHVTAVCHYLEEQKQLPSTITSMLTTMRTFCFWIGKAGMIGASEKYVKDPASVKRSMVTKSDKSWTGNDVNPEEIIEQIRAYRGGKEERVAVWVEQMFAFGLRIRESVMMRPGVGDKGEALYVREGTKGKRDRNVPLKTDWQRKVLERAKVVADKNSGRLGKRGLTVEQNIQHCYHVLRRLGITLADKGVSSHGLRHEYAHESHKELAGVEAPVKGGDISGLDRYAYREASLNLMERLGHSRASIGASYYGTRQGVRKQKVLEAGEAGKVGEAGGEKKGE